MAFKNQRKQKKHVNELHRENRSLKRRIKKNKKRANL